MPKRRASADSPGADLPPPAQPDPVLHLTAASAGAAATGRVVLEVGSERIPVEMTVPAGPVAVDDVLPIFQGLSSLFAARATAQAAAGGKAVSCRAGCGACCRQMVPIAAAEARGLARLVEAMPEPRREHVRQRFKAALATLNGLGLLDRLDQDPQNRRALAAEYFRAGVACPFLEDEACSIHPDRPLSCREYLVTSPPEQCAAPSSAIETLALEAAPSVALLRVDLRDGWVPLVLALDLDARAPPSPRDRLAADILKDVIRAL